MRNPTWSHPSVVVGLALGTACFTQQEVHAAETVAYTYDALGRLRVAAHAGSINNGVRVSFDFDAAGNRRSMMVTGATSSLQAQQLQALVGVPVMLGANLPDVSSGEVTFFSAGRALGSAPVRAGRAELVTTFSEPGTHVVIMQYRSAYGGAPLAIAAPVLVKLPAGALVGRPGSKSAE
jgi:YD repeat-containing protein